MVPEKGSTTERFFSNFGPFFALLPPPLPNNPENQNFEKTKKHLEISFYTSVP